MLSAQQSREFDEWGFLRIPGAFSRAQAAAMEDRVWAVLNDLYGVSRTAPETWALTQATGLQSLKTEPVFDAIGGPATLQVLDDLLGAGRWKKPRQWGQFLVSFPAEGRSWSVPSDIWHTDFAYLAPADRVFGALVFSFLSDVPPRSGGTAVLAGSHRLIRRFVENQPDEALEKMKRARKAFLLSDPWLKALSSSPQDPDRVKRFMEKEHMVDDIPARVTELTGNAGDVIVGHPWLLHAPALNCGTRPRIMRVQRVHSVDA